METAGSHTRAKGLGLWPRLDKALPAHGQVVAVASGVRGGQGVSLLVPEAQGHQLGQSQHPRLTHLPWHWCCRGPSRTHSTEGCAGSW